MATTILTVVIASLAGYALARTQMRGKTAILGFILVANFFPIIAMVGPLFIAYRRLGLLNSYPALVISCLIYTLPLATWLLSSYFSQPRASETPGARSAASQCDRVSGTSTRAGPPCCPSRKCSTGA